MKRGFMSWRQTFAKMIGVPEHQAEDALRSERAARATLTRRNLFAGGAALAANSVFSFPAAPAPSVAFPPIPFGANWYPYAIYTLGGLNVWFLRRPLS